MNILKLPSPNYFTPAEMDTNVIQAVVMHGTAGPVHAAINWLRDPQPGHLDNRVSSNYIISKLGVIYELVEWEKGLRAFANGIVENSDKSLVWLNDAIHNHINPNWITVSIEHEATQKEMINHASMTDAQFNSSIDLTAYILKATGLKATHQTIIGHNQISGTKKYNCPGVIFPPAYTEVLLNRHKDLA